MRFLFRWAFRLLLVAVLLVVALALLKDALLKSVAEQQIRSHTGLDVKIGRLEAGLLTPTLTIEDLKLYNTAEFGGAQLVDLPELHLEWQAAALAQRELHFRLVRVHLNELDIVESKGGETNIVGFVSELQELSATSTNRRLWMDLEFTGIDVLNLTLGKMHYSNLRQPGAETEIAFGLKNEILTGIRTLPELSNLILKLLVNRGITITTDGDHTSVTVHEKPPRRPPAGQSRPGFSPIAGASRRPK